MCYAEIPLLLEGGWHKRGSVDAVAGVRCPVEKRTGELRELRGLDSEILAVFDSWQWSEKDKLAACDIELVNDAGLDALKVEAGRLQEWAVERFEQRNADFAAWLDTLWPNLAAEFDSGGDAD